MEKIIRDTFRASIVLTDKIIENIKKEPAWINRKNETKSKILSMLKDGINVDKINAKMATIRAEEMLDEKLDKILEAPF
jgi:uncharacterized protein (DUF1697 family)